MAARPAEISLKFSALGFRRFFENLMNIFYLFAEISILILLKNARQST